MAGTVGGCARVALVGVCGLAWAASVAAQDMTEDACPREALRQMMAVGAKHGAIADVAALELEVLRLCVERQEVLREIVLANQALAELRHGASVRDAAPAPVLLAPIPTAVIPPPAKAALEAVAVVDESEAERREAREESPKPVVEARVVRRPRLSWRTVYGGAGEWIAGVSEGETVWYVREGDVLPSGVTVVSVRVRPAGVEVRHRGEQWQIPGPGGAAR